jgi:transglutaminase-like putative cysteine protease
MNFERFFKLSSYALICGGLLALVMAGGVGALVTVLFVAAAVTSWFLEGTKWQLSERMGLILIFALLPVFYLDYKYHFSGYPREQAAVATLARLILALAAIKLLQVKNDRDWFVLYVISFFEVLLAAGFSISPLLAFSFVVYLFLAVTTIITFEIRKSSRNINIQREKLLRPLRKTQKKKKTQKFPTQNIKAQPGELIVPPVNYRFPLVAVNLLILTLLLAIPLFFFLPRVGSAGLGGGSKGLSTSTGFSETVTLGAIAQLQQNSEIVMRVKVEGGAPNFRSFKWRGVALDTFDKTMWYKSRQFNSQAFPVGEDNLYKFNNESGKNRPVMQTIYLEPLDTPVLFGLPRITALQGSFESIIRDHNDSITMGRMMAERISYKVASDTYIPPEAVLREDNAAYTQDKGVYLQLPHQMDERFAKLTSEVIEKAGAKNRFDSAKAVESYLKNNFGYTLDLKMSGRDPLADFLFNIKQGHCEYFASAMAVMLRTQGIATRIVNGFQTGQYNETADMYIVRQKDAHSWVEVYFPGENVWVPFDPTPAAASDDGLESAGIFGRFNNYMEALDTLWIQYVVAYDNQDQRSLVRNLRQQTQAYLTQFSKWANSSLDQAQKTWSEISGKEGYEKQVNSAVTILIVLIAGVIAILLIINAVRFLWRSGWWGKLVESFRRKSEDRVVEFYGRMVAALKEKGFIRPPYETPVEFAGSLAIPEAIRITEAYNAVRFGEKTLTGEDNTRIEEWLSRLEAKE